MVYLMLWNLLMLRNLSIFFGSCRLMRGMQREKALWRGFVVVMCALVCFSSPTRASTYYVDFASGSDANDGTSTNAPWQHCPGDPNATGVCRSAALSAGSTVNFKGGVVYNGGLGFNYSWSGASGNPVTLQTAPSWGTGRAIMDGTYGGVTNGTAFLLGYYGGNNYFTVSGFEIRNYTHAGVHSSAYSTIISNNIIHHLGYFPYNIGNDGAQGFGCFLRSCGNPVCVSNVMYDINETACYPFAPTTNLTVWGNEFYWVQDHAIIGGANVGFNLIACNRIHDQTNQVTHDDGMHMMYWGEGSNVLIIANNVLWNNSQDVFLNGQANNGTAYIFNNLFLNASSFAAGGFGDSGQANGIVVNTQEYPWNNIYIFNNTIVLKNCGSAGMNVAGRGINLNMVGTNLWFYNNLLYQSYAVTSLPASRVLHTYAGYNCETNFLRGNWLGSNEVNSVYGGIVFSSLVPGNLLASDLRQSAGSLGVGSGSNLSSLIASNAFAFLPAGYQVDPTADALGVPRGLSWDAGAFQSPLVGITRPPTVKNLRTYKP